MYILFVFLNSTQESTECASMNSGMQHSGIMTPPWRSARVKETPNSKMIVCCIVNTQTGSGSHTIDFLKDRNQIFSLSYQ